MKCKNDVNFCERFAQNVAKSDQFVLFVWLIGSGFYLFCSDSGEGNCGLE